MLKNCKLVEFHNYKDERGNLVAIENPKNLEFPINRIYYIYGVDAKEERGFHSHKILHQVLIAISGSVKIRISTNNEEEIVELNDPAQGLYIGPMIWREMFDFSSDAVLLVLASEKYDESDYIRDKNIYLEEANNYFSNNLRKIIMKSKNLNVCYVNESDADFILSLRNDKNLGKYLSVTDNSLYNQINWIKNYKNKEKKGEEYYFKAFDSEGDLGFFRLYNIDKENKVLTFGSFIMKNNHPKYAAIESMILAMEFAFKKLKMKKVLLDVRVKNEVAKNFYNRFGFKKIDENDLDEFYELTREDYDELFANNYKNFL